jgi:hypothetical protein
MALYGTAAAFVLVPDTPADPQSLAPQDGVYQPYEDLLPYPSFSLRFSKEDIPALQASLAQMEPHEIVSMYKALRRWHKAFIWSKEQGGKAYDYTLASLHSRLHRLWGVLY